MFACSSHALISLAVTIAEIDADALTGVDAAANAVTTLCAWVAALAVLVTLADADAPDLASTPANAALMRAYATAVDVLDETKPLSVAILILVQATDAEADADAAEDTIVTAAHDVDAVALDVAEASETD